MDAIKDLLSIYPQPWPTDRFPVLRARLDRVRRQHPSGWEDCRQAAVLAVLEALKSGAPVDLERIASNAIERSRYKPGSRCFYSRLRAQDGKKARLPQTEVSDHSAENVGERDSTLEAADLVQREEKIRAALGKLEPILDAILEKPDVSVRELREQYPWATRRQIERVRAKLGDMARDMQREASLQTDPYVAEIGTDRTPAEQAAELEQLGLALLLDKKRPKPKRAETLRFGKRANLSG